MVVTGGAGDMTTRSPPQGPGQLMTMVVMVVGRGPQVRVGGTIRSAGYPLCSL